MTDLSNRNVLLTGAAGGLAGYLAPALAAAGAHVTLTDLEQTSDALNELRIKIEADGGRAAVITADLTAPDDRDTLIERVEEEIAPVEVLINNAAVEVISAYTEISDAELVKVAEVNFIAPLVLTRHALVGMAQRGFGHVVFMSSMAGKFGVAYCDPYAATKAGLIGLCQSLRREYAGTPIELSAVCPGFIAKAGMYARMEEEDGVRGSMIVSPERVSSGVLKAIRHNVPELILGDRSKPTRPVLVVGGLSPRMAERMVKMSGVDKPFREAAASRGRLEKTPAAAT